MRIVIINSPRYEEKDGYYSLGRAVRLPHIEEYEVSFGGKMEVLALLDDLKRGGEYPSSIIEAAYRIADNYSHLAVNYDNFMGYKYWEEAKDLLIQSL